MGKERVVVSLHHFLGRLHNLLIVEWVLFEDVVVPRMIFNLVVNWVRFCQNDGNFWILFISE